MKYNPIQRILTGPGRTLAITLAALTVLAQPAAHAAVTWSGATDTTWSTATNWVGDLAPISGDALVFGTPGAGGLVLNNDTTAGTSYAGITFNGSAGHFTIAGNSITCGGNITVGTNSVQAINFDLALDATRTLSVDTGSVLSLGGVVSGSFGLTKAGTGTVSLTDSNTYNGATTVSAGTLIAVTLADGGSPSSIGQSASDAANLTLTGGTLSYTGPAVSTDRSFTLAGNASLEAFGSGALNLTNTATPGYGGGNSARTLTLTGMTPGDNTLAALLTNNGSGAVAVTKAGSGTWVLSGANTYTGVTTLNGVTPTNGNTLIGAGTLVATILADGGSPSSIGQSGNAASNLRLGTGTTLKYIGSGHSTDRSFTINGDANPNIGATLNASGMGAINFTSTATPAYGTIDKTRTLILSGTSTATNKLSALLANNGTGAVSLIKAGIGTWSLNGNSVNTYTGGTSVNGGTLIEDFANLATPTNLINSASALAFGGGTLAVKGKDGSATSQTFGSPTFSVGGAGSGISVVGGSESTADLVLGNTWTRNLGSTVNVALGTGGTVTSSPAVDLSTPTPLVRGSGNIAFATFGGADWAKVSDGKIVAFVAEDYTAGLPDSGATGTENYSHSGDATVASSETANTLKLTTTTPGQSLAIAADQTLTLNAGGLLFVGADDYSITGGTVRGSGGTQKDLAIHQFGAGTLTVDSLIANNGTATTLTKCGPGNLTITTANTHTGATHVSGGTLMLKHQNALSRSTLTLNGASLLFDSSVTGKAFTLGQLASIANGPGYDITLQNNATTPEPIDLTVGGTDNFSATYVGSISGPGNLIKAGTGTLTLSGSNSYTGTTTVSKGVLTCGVASLDSFLGIRPGGPDVTVQSGATLFLNKNNITGKLTLNGGTLQHGNGFGATWDGSVVLSATSSFNITGNLNMTAVVSGSGGITKIGVATLTLTRANTYTGPTTVTAGVLKCDNPNALGGGALSISTGTTIKVNLNYTGTKEVASLTLGGVPQTASGTYGSLTSDAMFKSAHFDGNGKVSIGTAATLAYITSFGANVPGSFASIGTVSGNAATISWVVPPGSDLATLAPEFILSPGATCSNRTSGAIPTPNFGAGPLTYSIVSQDSSVTNVYTVNATVLVPESTVIWNQPAGGAWNLTTFNWNGQVSGQPTLYSDGANVIFNKTTGGTISIDPDMSPLTTTVSAASGTYIFVGGPITSGSLTKSGAGTLQLVGVQSLPPTGTPPVVANTYPGGTVIDGGTLILGGIVNTVTPGVNNVLGTGAVTLNAGTIQFNNNTIANALTVNGGTLSNDNGWLSTWGGAVTLNNNVTLTGTYSFVISGGITGSGGITKNGSATVTLSGTNTYTGPTTVTAGTLQCDSPNSVSGGALSISSGGAKANLNYTGTKVVASLSLGGIPKTATGTYGSVASGAIFQDDNYFTVGSTGTVRIGTDYNAWLGEFTFALDANTTPTGDPDGDGMTNQQEYAFGLDPTKGSSVNPITAHLDPLTGDFQYTRRATPADTKLAYTVLTSTDMGTWTSGGATETGFTTSGSGRIQTVTVHVTTTPVAGKLFVRVEAVPTP